MHATDTARARRLIGPAITDVAGEPAGQTQIDRLVARYQWTSGYCHDRIVLEVACGTGQGLGLLRRSAKVVFACDLSEDNLKTVRTTYGSAIPLALADAQRLPFADASVDVVTLLETIYFLPSATEFLADARRILKPGGCVLISAINKDCPDFNPNHPLYFERYGAMDLSALLRRHGFAPECFGIIPMNAPSARSRVFKPLKQLAVRLNLIPESMQARRLMKRIVFGRLQSMPRDIASLAAHRESATPISADEPDRIHQVILCAGRRT